MTTTRLGWRMVSVALAASGFYAIAWAVVWLTGDQSSAILVITSDGGGTVTHPRMLIELPPYPGVSLQPYVLVLVALLGMIAVVTCVRLLGARRPLGSAHPDMLSGEMHRE